MKKQIPTTTRQMSAGIYPNKLMIRVSDEMRADLQRISEATHIAISDIIRAAADAAIDAHSRYGMLTFPLKLFPPKAFEQAARAAKAVEEELSEYYIKETGKK